MDGSLHMKRAKTDAATQNYCPVCYSLSREQKLFNTKVERCNFFYLKMHRNWRMSSGWIHWESL